MLPVLVKEHEPVVDGQEAMLVGHLYFEDYMGKLMRIFICIPLEWNSMIFSLKSYMREVFSMKSTKISLI
jgi:hypothetical protein